MDVLLVQPRISRSKRMNSEQFGVMPPMMLHYLAQPLRELDFDVDILDLTIYNMDKERFVDYIDTYRPKVVGITCATISYYNAIRAADYIKDIDEDIKVVIGGPHVTFETESALSNDSVDYIIRGEGDISFAMLVEHILRGKYSLSEIAGLSYRRDGGIVNNTRYFIENVDAIRFPSRTHPSFRRYQIPGIIQASRGCPFQCRFCAAGAIAGGKYRRRSVESITAEIDYLVTVMGFNNLAFADDTLTGFPGMTRRLCNHILDRGYSITWACESRVDVADRDLLELMARSGCQTIQFGFESGSPEILKSINKRISPKQMEHAVELCADIGLRSCGNFMIGFPDDTWETIKETYRVARKLKSMGSVIGIAVLTPFPGTYFFNHAQESGLTIHSDNWDDYDLENPIISTKHLSQDDLRAILFDFDVSLNKTGEEPEVFARF